MNTRKRRRCNEMAWIASWKIHPDDKGERWRTYKQLSMLLRKSEFLREIYENKQYGVHIGSGVWMK